MEKAAFVTKNTPSFLFVSSDDGDLKSHIIYIRVVGIQYEN